MPDIDPDNFRKENEIHRTSDGREMQHGVTGLQIDEDAIADDTVLERLIQVIQERGVTEYYSAYTNELYQITDAMKTVAGMRAALLADIARVRPQIPDGNRWPFNGGAPPLPQIPQLK